MGGVETLSLEDDRLTVTTSAEVAVFDAESGRVLSSSEREGGHVAPTPASGEVEAPDGAVFENADEGLIVLDPVAMQAIVELPVEWPQFDPGPVLVAGERAYTGLSDGRLVCLGVEEGDLPSGPPSAVLEGLSIMLTGVGRALGSMEQDREHRAAVVRWLVEDVAGVEVAPGTSPVEVVAGLDRAAEVAGVPPSPGADVPDELEVLYRVLSGLVGVVADQDEPVSGDLLRRLVFEPLPGATPSGLAWSAVAGPAAQLVFAAGVRAAVDRAGVDAEALPPFTGDREELAVAVGRAVFADERTMADPLVAALAAADGVDGWQGDAFEVLATGDWPAAVASASAEQGEWLLVRYPQLLDTTAALVAVAVVLRQAVADPSSAPARLAELRVSGERLLASFGTSTEQPGLS